MPPTHPFLRHRLRPRPSHQPSPFPLPTTLETSRGVVPTWGWLAAPSHLQGPFLPTPLTWHPVAWRSGSGVRRGSGSLRVPKNRVVSSFVQMACMGRSTTGKVMGGSSTTGVGKEISTRRSGFSRAELVACPWVDQGLHWGRRLLARHCSPDVLLLAFLQEGFPAYSLCSTNCAKPLLASALEGD
jgi:hypothetical protein